jgi:hypothetical protein
MERFATVTEATNKQHINCGGEADLNDADSSVSVMTQQLMPGHVASGAPVLHDLY